MQKTVCFRAHVLVRVLIAKKKCGWRMCVIKSVVLRRAAEFCGWEGSVCLFCEVDFMVWRYLSVMLMPTVVVFCVVPLNSIEVKSFQTKISEFQLTVASY